MKQKMRVVDLEKFVLEHIFRPYQNKLGMGDVTLKKLTKEYNLDTARGLMIKNKEWTQLVMGRLSKIGVEFPEYIQHPFVRFLKNMLTIDWDSPSK